MKWGLMNVDGEIALEPKYDAIGEFKQYGYAVMQRNGGVGLLNNYAKEIIDPKYEDLKVLDSTLVAVMDESQWLVINLEGKIILDKGYDRVSIWNEKYLAYQKKGKWGIASREGDKICEPAYDFLEMHPQNYFITYEQENMGLLSLNGDVILEPLNEDIKILNDDLFLFKKNRKWGIVDSSAIEILPPQYDSFYPINENFLKLVNKGLKYLYSDIAKAVISKDEYNNFYSFSADKVLCKKQRRLGLISGDGEILLEPEYHEIHAYSEGIYRVNFDNKWGLVTKGNNTLVDYEYEFIAPTKAMVAVVRKEGKLGLVNLAGEIVLDPTYGKILIEEDRVKASQGSDLKLFVLDENGRIKDENEFKKHVTIKIGKRDQTRVIRRNARWTDDDYRLENFEWFYEPRSDKWGLRKLENAEIVIEPTYDWIKIERAYGFTIVGIDVMQEHRLDRTAFKTEMVYGLVNNEVGKLTTFVNIWDIRFLDFERGLPTARVVFDSGRHGLITRKGKVIQTDMAYIGEFSNGLARFSPKGKLSGSLKAGHRGLEVVKEYWSSLETPNYMTSYTTFDRKFNDKGRLICEECFWGYIDTSGIVVTAPVYDFAKDFVNEVGIVECEGKWGMVNPVGDILIKCNYDGINFLENTDNEILQIFINRQKYGLIDTLGQVTVSLMYDELGDFSNGRLAVKKGDRWGYVNKNGLEIIPCFYKKVRNFNEGYAAVKKDSKWGMINKNGDVVIDFEYSQIGNLKSGLIWFGNSLGKGYMDKNAEVVIEPKFQTAEDFDGNVAVVKLKGSFGLIDKTGKFVERPKFIHIDPFNQYGLAKVKYGNDNMKYGYINKSGNLINNTGYKFVGDYKDGLVSVRDKSGYGFMDTSGKVVVSTKYSKVSNFCEGLAMVQKNNKCGYIDTLGNQVIKCTYSKCLDFDEGKAVVYRGYKKGGLIDRTGAYIIEPGLNKMLSFEQGRGLVRENEYKFYYITEQAKLYEGYYEDASSFKHGVAVVRIDGRWGIINQKGIEIIPPKYDKIENFEGGYAKVRIKEFSGLTNLKGELIIDPDYEYISYAGEGLFRVEQGDKIGYFDKEGKWIWGLQK